MVIKSGLKWFCNSVAEPLQTVINNQKSISIPRHNFVLLYGFTCYSSVRLQLNRYSRWDWIILVIVFGMIAYRCFLEWCGTKSFKLDDALKVSMVYWLIQKLRRHKINSVPVFVAWCDRIEARNYPENKNFKRMTFHDYCPSPLL